MIRLFKKIGKGIWRGLKFGSKAVRHPAVRFGLTFVGHPEIVAVITSAVSLIDHENMSNEDKHSRVRIATQPVVDKFGLSDSQADMIIKGVVAELRGEAVIEVDND